MKFDLTTLSTWRWYHIVTTVVLADAAMVLFLWRDGSLWVNRLVAPILVGIGWFAFIQARADRFNDEGQCARCGCDLAETKSVFMKAVRPIGAVYMFCRRCGIVKSIEIALAAGLPVTVGASFVLIINWDTPWLVKPVAASILIWIVVGFVASRATNMKDEVGKPVYSSIPALVLVAVSALSVGALVLVPRYL